MTRLEPAEYHRLLHLANERMAGIDPATLTAPIPHIEGWTVHSVVGHTGWLLRYISLNLAAPADNAPPRSAIGEPPLGEEVLAWFAEGAAEVEGALAAADLDELHPSWTGPQPSSWWLRRVAHEMTMHCWDAQSAAGSPDPIDAELSCDGVDEMLEVFVPNRLHFDALAGSGETIHLHATDLDHGEWLMELLADEVRWEHGHAKGDVAARGPASDLLLLMWSRLPPSRLEVFGDASLLDRWQQAAKF